MDLRIGGIYKVTKNLGKNGTIFSGVNQRTKEEVAIKVGRINHDVTPMILYESKVCAHFKGAEGFPRMHACVADGELQCMITSIHGPNLQQLFDFCDNKFNALTIVKIGLQLIERLEFLHQQTFVYRNVKPENILIGKGKKQNTLYLIDFARCKRYICPRTSQHISFKKGKKIPEADQILYMPMREHSGKESSRRDDLEGLGIMLIKLFRGKTPLPWELPPLILPNIPI